MPEQPSKLDATRDPSVTKQYDQTADFRTKLDDLYTLTDAHKVCMFGTHRPGIGPTSRCMSLAKRSGPDFLFLTNANSTKCQDLAASPDVSLTFHDPAGKQDWVSVTGRATTTCTGDDDPRVQEVYSRGVAAWFGDLGDGVHDGGPRDPRVVLVEVQSRYIVYYKSTAGALSMAKEIGGALLTGGVAKTGVLREVHEDEIKQARVKDSALTS